MCCAVCTRAPRNWQQPAGASGHSFSIWGRLEEGLKKQVLGPDAPPSERLLRSSHPLTHTASSPEACHDRPASLVIQDREETAGRERT